MAQLKKFGIFDAITQFMTQKYGEVKTGGFTRSDITGRFIHRGEKRRSAYRHGRGKGWKKC